MRRERFFCFSCSINSAESRSAYPSACVTMAAAIRPLRLSTSVQIGQMRLLVLALLVQPGGAIGGRSCVLLVRCWPRPHRKATRDVRDIIVQCSGHIYLGSGVYCPNRS